MLVQQIFNDHMLALDPVKLGREEALREVALVKLALLWIGPLEDPIVVDAEVFEPLHVTSCEVELGRALAGGLKGIRRCNLRRVLDLGRNNDVFDHSITLGFVLLDEMGVADLFLAEQHFPVLRMMLNDFIQVLVVLLLQMAKLSQILKRRLMDRLRQLLLLDEALHHSGHTLGKRLQVVPALQYAEHWLAELLQPPGHVVVGVGSDCEAADRVVPCRIEAAGDEEEVRVEGLDDGVDDPVVEVDVFVVAWGLEGKLRPLFRMVVQWDV